MATRDDACAHALPQTNTAVSPFWIWDPYAQEAQCMQHKQYFIQTLM